MPHRIAEKVLLVGWDGADWQVIRPLLDQGLMPHLGRLIERGASGTIAALQPMLSPVLWTAIATGKWPYQHGVHGLSEPNPEAGGIRRASSTSRTTKAIWNILTQNDMTTHVIGWRGAHPAEPIRGVNVTDMHAVATVEFGKHWPQPDGSFHPAELGPTLAALRLHPHQLDRESLEFFVPQMATIGTREIPRLTACARGLAATVTNHAVATWAMEHRPWDMMAVCYGGIEYFSQAFMQNMPPRQESVSADEFALYQHVVPACYRFHDRMLGRLLELAGDGTTIVLVSDHGFKTGAMRPPAIARTADEAEAWHRRTGVCVVHGRHIKPASTISCASVLDVTPTVLALLGLPLGRDMDGRPWLELFDAAVETTYVESWDQIPGQSGMHPIRNAESTRELQAMLQQLADLGYSDPREAQLAALERRVAEKNRLNLARSLMEGGRLAQAVAILEELTATTGRSNAVTVMLIESYLLAGRYQDAQTVVEGSVSEPANALLVNMTLGRIELAQRRPGAALMYLQRAEPTAGGNPRVHAFIGQAFLQLRRWPEARAAFMKALELEPDHAEALHGMCVVCLREHRAHDAADYALAAINSYEPMAAAHYHLGAALAMLGRFERAARAWERAVALDPTFRAARRRLMRLYDRELHDPSRAAEHQRLDVQVRQERAMNP
jgi:tetratricopeptide (TPR) repeat protein